VDKAVRKVGLDGVTPHVLRHTAASLMIATKANVKVVQRQLGHKSATQTLDRYGHLYGDELDALQTALDVTLWRLLRTQCGLIMKWRSPNCLAPGRV
jgi:integrase